MRLEFEISVAFFLLPLHQLQKHRLFMRWNFIFCCCCSFLLHRNHFECSPICMTEFIGGNLWVRIKIVRGTIEIVKRPIVALLGLLALSKKQPLALKNSYEQFVRSIFHDRVFSTVGFCPKSRVFNCVVFWDRFGIFFMTNVANTTICTPSLAFAACPRNRTKDKCTFGDHAQVLFTQFHILFR